MSSPRAIAKQSTVLSITTVVCSLLVSSSFGTPGPSPPFIKGRADIYVLEEGKKLKLRCDVRGKPRPAVTWSKNGRALEPDSRVKIQRRSTILRIEHASTNDSGIYFCRASNKWGSSNKSMLVNVTRNISSKIDDKVPPSFLNRNKMDRRFVITTALETLNLNCMTKGSVPLQCEWVKEGRPVLPVRRFTSKPVNECTLRLKQLKPGDSGNYTCIVSNQYGSIQHSYWLRVQVSYNGRPLLKPGFPANTTAQLGQRVVLPCIAIASSGLPHFRWIKWKRIPRNYPGDLNFEDDAVTDLPPGRFKTMSPSELGFTHLQPKKSNPFATTPQHGLLKPRGVKLVIRNLTEDDLGMYTCIAEDARGMDYASAFISKKTTPQAGTPPSKQPVTVAGHTADSNANVELKNGDKRVTMIVLLVLVVIAVVLGLAIALVLCWRHKLLVVKKKRLNAQPTVLEGLDQAKTHTSRRSCYVLGLTSRSTAPSAQGSHELPLDKQWEIDRSLLEIKEQLGEGSFGKVLRAETFALPGKSDKTTVAVKTLKDDATEIEFRDLVSEMETMKGIGRHKNIINLIGACTQDGPLFVVVEFAPHDSLGVFLKKRRTPSSEYPWRTPLDTELLSLTVRDLVSFALQISNGMEYLASKKCVHRDLAARNVLVGEDYVMKIADFGMARNMRDANYYRKITDGRLPMKWLPTETLLNRIFTTKTDVWSFGVLLWEIFTLGGTPYPGIPVERLYKLLETGYRMPSPQHCPSQIYKLMSKCWDSNPNARPSFTLIKEELDTKLSSMTNETYLEILSLSADDLDTDVNENVTDEPPPEVLVIG